VPPAEKSLSPAAELARLMLHGIRSLAVGRCVALKLSGFAQTMQHHVREIR
jgi:hypothetical protein